MPSTTASTSSSNHTINYTSVLDGVTRGLEQESYGYGSCRKVNEFDKLNRVGEGTYGVVYRAKDTKSGQIVALKQVRIDDKTAAISGISESALREIGLLKRLKHENIVRLKEVAVSKSIRGIYLVMEYCQQDLASLLDNLALPFTVPQVKCLTLQLFRALEYMHSHYVLHRDLKVSNLLLTDAGILKVADFGLARIFGDEGMFMTPRVVTLWYRCPELLLGSRVQTEGVDTWAAGCILGELLLHRPLLPGKGDLDQIEKIISLLGTPTEKIWPGLESLPEMEKFTLRSQPYNNLKVVFESVSPEALHLLNCLFTYDPSKRMSAKQVLLHPYFTEAPLPCEPALMPSFPQHRNQRKRPRSKSPIKLVQID